MHARMHHMHDAGRVTMHVHDGCCAFPGKQNKNYPARAASPKKTVLILFKQKKRTQNTKQFPPARPPQLMFSFFFFFNFNHGHHECVCRVPHHAHDAEDTMRTCICTACIHACMHAPPLHDRA
jgi:hypothetical protein